MNNQSNPSSTHCSNEEEVSSAIDFLVEKLTLNPEDLIILDRLALLSFRLGNLEAAYNYADRILQLDNNNRDSYIIRAACFMAWNNPVDALEEINIAISLSNSAKEICSKIEEHYRDSTNDNTILEVEPNPELAELLKFRDLIISKMHTSMTGMYG